MKKLTVVVKHSRRNEVLEIFESCAAYGIMIEDISGYGNQRGSSTKYRGVIQPVTCLSKVRIETVGDDETIQIIINLLQERLKTGTIGDGKLFIENVEDVVRIRTGEHGIKAL
ncbi:MAG: P-II family nitrogen regulator [Butyrivibrio sp.]|uniref:P-II family nitrogen regulator n=1 Tax=Butyrivibrio sp. TaxID=28121 RepID=UPI0025D01A88|nr:P-II family nitrogen regulator [Butyrivibrio sp.]MCR5771055.1 P-II family nitrogen regulator [Butyrivibrio sp.]